VLSELKDIPVLITGASGFIGSHLARRLVREGARVTALVFPDCPRTRLSDIEEKIAIYPVDIRDGSTLMKLMEKIKPRKIFHLAGITSVDRSPSKLDRTLSVNLGGTLNLLRALARIEYDAFICTCTAEAYGKNQPPFREEMALDPQSPYSLSKAAATLACKTWANSFGARVTVLRLFLVYGPGQEEERFLPHLIKSGLTQQPLRMTPGEQTREYTYIDDVIDSFLLAAEKGRGRGEVINIGTGREISLRDLVTMVESILGRPVVRSGEPLPYRKNEIWRIIGDHSRAAEELKWHAVTDLEIGLKKTIDWYRKQLQT